MRQEREITKEIEESGSTVSAAPKTEFDYPDSEEDKKDLEEDSSPRVVENAPDPALTMNPLILTMLRPSDKKHVGRTSLSDLLESQQKINQNNQPAVQESQDLQITEDTDHLTVHTQHSSPNNVQEYNIALTFFVFEQERIINFCRNEKNKINSSQALRIGTDTLSILVVVGLYCLFSFVVGVPTFGIGVLGLSILVGVGVKFLGTGSEVFHKEHNAMKLEKEMKRALISLTYAGKAEVEGYPASVVSQVDNLQNLKFQYRPPSLASEPDVVDPITPQM